ncbi:MAG: DsbA family protein [Candidatus Eisenbacteria bacterium]|uniref:DsbA family protein n=1 Tax=Eiseniibacteriota bacterium TaxID=2212470 RepID=A0A956M0A1_UNCEI|nr:DsbA family protein [Candidatus Eisenbacteria bacterium]
MDRLLAEYDIEVHYVNFPLHPDTPDAGIALVDLFGGGPAAQQRLASSSTRLRGIADSEGLPMSESRTMTYNSRLAQELGVWATEQGQGKAFHDAMFRAYFAHAQNISDPEVLVQIAKDVGLDATTARDVIESRSYQAAVDEEWSRSRAAGVNAVPTFDCGGQRVVGAYPYETLAGLVEHAGARKRADR